MAFSCYSVFLRTSPTPIQLPPPLLVLDLCVCLCVYVVRMKLQSHVIQFMTLWIKFCCHYKHTLQRLAVEHFIMVSHTHTLRQLGGSKETRVGFSKNWSIQHAGKHSQLEWERERERRRLEEYGADNTKNLENTNICYCCVWIYDRKK